MQDQYFHFGIFGMRLQSLGASDPWNLGAEGGLEVQIPFFLGTNRDMPESSSSC